MDMETIVKVVQERVGLSEEKARTAVNVVVEHLRKAVPPQYAGLVDSVLGSNPVGTDAPETSGEPQPAASGLGAFLRGLGH